MKPVNPSVFRAYDIRGVVDRDFDAHWVHQLGRACGAYFLRHGWTRAVVGRDARHSSPDYAAAMARGLADTGVDAVLLGMVPTPVFYFACVRLGIPAGVMVTASHNPPEFNGFKIWGGKTTLHSEQIAAIRDLMLAGDYPEGAGLVSDHDILPTYLREVAALVDIPRPVRVVLDGGNGAAGEVCADLLERAGVSVDRLYCEPDGDFPNHHPDPVVEANIGDLKARVVQTGADMGIGLDGDGDRIGLVDEKGRLVDGDRLLACYAREILSRKPGAAILADVKCSQQLFDDIEAHGGRAVMGVTGHSTMKARLLEEGAEFGGEMSGHMFFSDRFFGYDDAAYAALRVAELAASDQYAGRPVSSWLDDWPELFSTPEIRAHCPEDIKFAVVDRVLQALRHDHEVVDMDGVRVIFPDGWGLVRASNTQAAITLRFEARSPERLAEIRTLVEGEVARARVELDKA